MVIYTQQNGDTINGILIGLGFWTNDELDFDYNAKY